MLCVVSWDDLYRKLDVLLLLNLKDLGKGGRRVILNF